MRFQKLKKNVIILAIYFKYFTVTFSFSKIVDVSKIPKLVVGNNEIVFINYTSKYHAFYFGFVNAKPITMKLNDIVFVEVLTSKYDCSHRRSHPLVTVALTLSDGALNCWRRFDFSGWSFELVGWTLNLTDGASNLLDGALNLSDGA